MQRRELFSSLASSIKGDKKQEKVLRPPYFGDESLFQSECSKCDAKCATVCEEEIIKIADDKTPYIVFSTNGCTYCDKCAIACEFGVLNLKDKKILNATITIDRQKCLSWNHTMCFSCKDPCLDNAIDFAAMFMPVINDKCTACGFCISRCPTDAIDIKVL
ncbi:ferredoxin-type protein NapF [Sulfurimonas sp.]|uniref:ferredoxin-type protein NapF n=1 Tax=Sulfurimonas sp. TaxID=2022749 RepID=UPI0026134729|nr:ferredoxin-type protein NapF [Sulfurimonas sp.]MCW8895268.1 ferredoxin-type protein NapF [Sulfurimonas sp.]